MEDDYKTMPVDLLEKRIKLYEDYLETSIKDGEKLRARNLLDEQYHRSQLEKKRRIIEEIKQGDLLAPFEIKARSDLLITKYLI